MSEGTLAKTDPRDIQLGKLTLTAVGISGRLVKPPTIEEFQGALAFIGRAAGASNWWIGDLANYADQWGDEYIQLLDGLGVEYDKLRKCAEIARGVQFANRFANLSWTHHATVSALAPPDQKRWLTEAQPKEGDTKPRLSVSELKAAIRAERMKAEREANPFPEGKYRILYADPPWKYSDELLEGYGAAEHHYPTMSIAELCSLADASGRTVKDVATDDAALFLWVTAPLLDECWPVINAWGFDYKTCFVWDKVAHNYGHYSSVRHELLLLSTRGSCLPDDRQLVDSVVTVDRAAIHSQKPEQFYDIIEQLYPSGSRLELFARTQRQGWEVWGNQAPKK